MSYDLDKDLDLAKSVAYTITVALDLEQYEEIFEIMRGTMNAYGSTYLPYKLATMNVNLAMGATGLAETYYGQAFTEEEREKPVVRLLAAVLEFEKGSQNVARQMLADLVKCDDQEIAFRAKEVLRIIEVAPVA